MVLTQYRRMDNFFCECHELSLAFYCEELIKQYDFKQAHRINRWMAVVFTVEVSDFITDKYGFIHVTN